MSTNPAVPDPNFTLNNRSIREVYVNSNWHKISNADITRNLWWTLIQRMKCDAYTTGHGIGVVNGTCPRSAEFEVEKVTSETKDSAKLCDTCYTNYKGGYVPPTQPRTVYRSDGNTHTKSNIEILDDDEFKNSIISIRCDICSRAWMNCDKESRRSLWIRPQACRECRTNRKDQIKRVKSDWRSRFEIN